MRYIEEYEAKIHLEELLEQVQNGKQIIIMKGNSPIAKLLPFAKNSVKDVQNAIDDLRAFRRKQTLEINCKSLKDDGRK
ncbi:MAG: type II toxin-antitoxin system prevent-host-death family antitoxin [Gammaproteobacteria bacterium]|nr:type II toxin-antitoxin system prevent-host-death family antitoxin [Gammaproteobacteria bacterium]